MVSVGVCSTKHASAFFPPVILVVVDLKAGATVLCSNLFI